MFFAPFRAAFFVYVGTDTEKFDDIFDDIFAVKRGKNRSKRGKKLCPKSPLKTKKNRILMRFLLWWALTDSNR